MYEEKRERRRDAQAGSRTRVTSMGGLYDTATLHAPCERNPVAKTRDGFTISLFIFRSAYQRAADEFHTNNCNISSFFLLDGEVYRSYLLVLNPLASMSSMGLKQDL